MNSIISTAINFISDGFVPGNEGQNSGAYATSQTGDTCLLILGIILAIVAFALGAYSLHQKRQAAAAGANSKVVAFISKSKTMAIGAVITAIFAAITLSIGIFGLKDVAIAQNTGNAENIEITENHIQIENANLQVFATEKVDAKINHEDGSFEIGNSYIISKENQDLIVDSFGLNKSEGIDDGACNWTVTLESSSLMKPVEIFKGKACEAGTKPTHLQNLLNLKAGETLTVTYKSDMPGNIALANVGKTPVVASFGITGDSPVPTPTITGSVKDVQYKQGMKDATVRLFNSEDSEVMHTTTNAEGKYGFNVKNDFVGEVRVDVDDNHICSPVQVKNIGEEVVLEDSIVWLKAKDPVYSKILFYNGNELDPIKSKGQHTSVETGQVSAIECGTYKFRVTPRQYAMWDDFSTQDREYEWQIIERRIGGYYVNGVDFDNFYSQIDELANKGLNSIILSKGIFNYKTKEEVKQLITELHNKNIVVHYWMQVWYEGGWISPLTDPNDQKFRQDLVNLRKTEAEDMLDLGYDGISLDYIRFGGTAEQYGVDKATAAISETIKQLNETVKAKNKNALITASMMADSIAENRKFYGQDIYEMSKYLDAIVPMVYKGNYKTDTAWIKQRTSEFRNASNGAEIWSAVQSYRNDSDPSPLPIDELTEDAQAAVDGGATGVILFRYGLSEFLSYNNLNYDYQISGELANALANNEINANVKFVDKNGKTLANQKVNKAPYLFTLNVPRNATGRIVCEVGEGWVAKSSEEITVSSSQSLGIFTVSMLAQEPQVEYKFYYDGVEKTPLLSEGKNVTVSGTIKATEVGTYEFVVTPTAGTYWSDYTNAPKTIKWKIYHKKTSAIYLNGADLDTFKTVRDSEFLANNYNTIILSTGAFTEEHVEKGKELIVWAHKLGVTVNIWLQVYYYGQWISPFDEYERFDYKLMEQRVAEVNKYMKDYDCDGLSLDYIRLGGTAEKHGVEKSCDAVEEATRILSEAARSIKPECRVSAAVMPDNNADDIRYYGQDVSRMSKHVDAICPMIYRKDAQDASYISNKTKDFVSRLSGGQVWSALQTYTDNAKAARAVDMLTTDIQAAFDGGASGAAMFRFGVFGGETCNFVNFQDIKFNSSIEGTVTNPDNTPAVGIELRFIDKNNYLVASAVTDAEGKYKIVVTNNTEGDLIVVNVSKVAVKTHLIITNQPIMQNITVYGIAKEPGLKGWFKHDGKEKSAVISPGSHVIIKGNQAGTEIGSYTFTMEPDSNYAWADGTTSKKTYTWKIIPEHANGYYLWSTNMIDIQTSGNLEKLASTGTNTIILNFAAYNKYSEAQIKEFYDKCHSLGMEVQLWIQVFYNGSWVSALDEDENLRQDIIDLRKADIERYLNHGADGISLDYIRFGGGAHKHGVQRACDAITETVRQLAEKTHEVKPSARISAAIMPEPGDSCRYWYGQDIPEMSKYLDSMCPMIYKGNYESTRQWIKDTTQTFVNMSSGAEIWTTLQSYCSDDHSVPLPYDEYYEDAKVAIAGGTQGLISFRYGLSEFLDYNKLWAKDEQDH